MRMKTRIVMITTILAMACIVWLIGENHAYKAQYEKQRIKEAELIDDVFDIQERHDVLFEAIYKAEDKLDSLVDYTHKLELELMNK